MTAVWQLDSRGIIRVGAATEQVSRKQQANDDDGSQEATQRLKLQRLLLLAVVVAARAPSRQTNERRMTNETQAGENGYRKQTLAAQLYSSASWTLPHRFMIIAFVSCVYMWWFQPQRRRLLALFALCLTYPVDFWQVELFYDIALGNCW